MRPAFLRDAYCIFVKYLLGGLDFVLVLLDHLLERVTRTNSQIFKIFVRFFACEDLNFKVEPAVFRCDEYFVDIFVDELFVDHTVRGVALCLAQHAAYCVYMLAEILS